MHTRVAIFNRFSHPCAVIDDVLSDVWERVFANMSLDVWTWWDGTTINVGVWIGARVDFVVDLIIDVLACVCVDAITVITALEFTMSSS